MRTINFDATIVGVTLLFAIALTFSVLAGCADKSYNVTTPYGDVTSGTVNLDLTPLFPPAPTPIPTLEK